MGLIFHNANYKASCSWQIIYELIEFMNLAEKNDKVDTRTHEEPVA